MTTATAKRIIPKERIYSFEEYIQKEEKSLTKHEFYQGQILKMPGAKYRHNHVACNIVTAINIAVHPLVTDYIVLNSDQKIYIESEDICVYPDALVISKNPIFWQEREDILINPLVVVEVASRSTALIDRTTKFLWYKSLPSFKEYILIDPNKLLVETWSKKDENTWITKTATDMNDSINIPAIEGITILVSDIYKRVKFPVKPIKKPR